MVKLKLSLRKYYGRHHDLVDRYGISVSQMTMGMLHLSKTLPGPFLIHGFHRVYNYINTTGTTSGAGTAYPSGSLVFTLCF